MTNSKSLDESQPDDTATLSEEAAEETPADEIKKLQQTVEMRDVGPCKKHIKVTVEREDVDALFDEKYSELVGEAHVPGFRPGKVPRKVIERRFYKDVAEQVKSELLLTSLEQIAEEQNLAPLSPPKLDLEAIEIPKEGPLIYEFEVEVRPEFELPPYKGLKLKRGVRTFTEEDVAAERYRLLAPDGQIVPKPEGNAQVGDVLVADVTTRDGDRVLNRIKELVIRIDPQLAFRDGMADKFGEEVRGANPGDRRTVRITLSNSVADASLRGKTITAYLEIKEVKKIRLPELTHDYLHRFGVHTPEQLDELIRVRLQRRLDYAQRSWARQQVMDLLAGSIDWELPEELLIRQARRAINRRIMEMRAEGVPEHEIRGRQRVLQQDTLRSTAQSLKEHFILQKIAEVENIDVDEDDLDREIERWAERNNESVRRVRARFEKEELLDVLAAEIVERKALDLILDSAEYTDVAIEGEEDRGIATVEEQTVPGEMKDPVDAPQPEPITTAGTGGKDQSEKPYPD